MRNSFVSAARAVVLVLGLAACGGGSGSDDVQDNARATPALSTATPGTTTTTAAIETTSAPAPTEDDGLPTVPPGDPGDVSSAPEDTSDVEEPEPAPRTSIPVAALLDTETVAAVVGGSWRAVHAASDSCDVPRPAKPIATRTAALSASSGQLVETVASHASGQGAAAAVDGLAHRAVDCGWTQEAEPPLGEDSAALSRTTPDGLQRLVVVASEGVTVTLHGRGQIVDSSEDWAALLDVAIGTACLAAPDGCH